jgi:hypothetical protein
MAAAPTLMAVNITGVAGEVAPGRIVAVVLDSATLPESLVASCTVTPLAGAGADNVIVKAPVWFRLMLVGAASPIEPGACTVTVADAEGTPGADAVIVEVPADTAVTTNPTAVEDSLMKTLDRIVATPGLLDVSEKLSPPGGAGFTRMMVSTPRPPLSIVRLDGFSVTPLFTTSASCLDAL